VDGHDRHHRYAGVGQDSGGLVGLEARRAQCGGQGVAAMPEPPGGVELQPAWILFGVDGEHPAGADGEVINVGCRAWDGQVVQDRPPVPLQRTQQAGGASLPRRSAPPSAGVRAGPNRSPQPATIAASPPTNRPSRGTSRPPRTPPPAPMPRVAATRHGRLRVQAVHSAARNRRQVTSAEPPGRPTLARTRTATTG
jgi:hypothetical protein